MAQVVKHGDQPCELLRARFAAEQGVLQPVDTAHGQIQHVTRALGLGAEQLPFIYANRG